MRPRERVIVALDFEDPVEARRFVRRQGAVIGFYKVGSILFTRAGPAFIRFLKDQGKKVFLDLKFHDIPNTVGGAAEVCAELGVDMFNVHASGGRAMMREVAERLRSRPKSKRPLAIGVTVLTSMDETGFKEACGSVRPLADHVVYLARLARDAGLDGVVASAQEAKAVKLACGPSFIVITPGIRLPTDEVGDQARVVTPELAIRLGADYLVVGRPITGASDPGRAARLFCDRIADCEVRQ